MKKILFFSMTLFLGLVLSGSGCNHDAIDPGVEINGVIWATCNVAAPGKFATTPEDPGMMYQWNRLTAYPATGGLPTNWDATWPNDTWNSANDPCPNGWRMPTLDDIDNLLSVADYEWTGDGARFTYAGKSIYLPASGGRHEDGALFNTVYSYIKTSTVANSTLSYNLGCTDVTPFLNTSDYNWAHPIRCVKN
jgi:hypothetical protein